MASRPTLSARILFRFSRTFRDNARRAKKATKATRRLTKATLGLLIKANALDEVNFLIKKMDPDQLRQLGRSRIMGTCRFFVLHGKAETAANLLSIYLARGHPYDILYFLEPLKQMQLVHCSGLQGLEPKIRECSQSVVEWLRKEYLPADEFDMHNFTSFVIEPLRLLEENGSNLMEIRFSEAQRAALRDKIKKCLLSKNPLSLVRLGDGEAYPYRPPPVQGIDPNLFERDIRNFELSAWGQSPPPAGLAEEYKTRFLEAIARADIVGVPSVYRIIRNLTNPHTRYGNRRNQRGFMRILAAIGGDIPLSDKVFTEERCQRISAAIDEQFLLALAGLAQSVILISCREQIAIKFKAYEPTLFLIPPHIRQLIGTYQGVVDRIRSSCGRGTLVIIGAGQIGKIFADEARQTGAVALDVGALLDYMVGLKTRTIADLV